MGDEYRIEPYTPDTRAAVIAMHRRLMPRRRGTNDRYFTWKYERNPYLDAPLMALVYQRDQLVAMRGLSGTSWMAPGSSTPIMLPRVDDLFVDEDHRGRGLFLMLDKALTSIAASLGHTHIISLSGGPQTQDLARIAGWMDVVELDRRFRPSTPETRRTRWEQAGRTWTRRIIAKATGGPHGAPGRRTADRLVADIAASNPHISVTSEPPIAELAATGSQPAEDTWRHDRSETFLRWRYANPDRTYRFVTWSDGQVRGVVSLALMPHDHHRAKVAASWAEAPEILEEILTAVVHDPTRSVEVLTSSVQHLGEPTLATLGLVDDPDHRHIRRRSFMMRSTDRRSLSTLPGEWHVDLIDTMLA